MRTLTDDKSKAIVVSAVVRLLERWRLNESQKVAILGFKSESDYGGFVASPSKIYWSTSLELRVSLILNIHAKLRLLFSNPSNLYGYMTMINNNPPFFGKTPIEFASQGLESLKAVYSAVSSNACGAEDDQE